MTNPSIPTNQPDPEQDSEDAHVARMIPTNQPDPEQDSEDEHVARIAAVVAASLDHDMLAQRAARRVRRDPLVLALLAMLGVSLLVHAVTMFWLFSVRDLVHAQIDLLADQVLAAKDERLTYQLPIKQSVPIDVSIPISQSLEFPINTSVKIKQTVNLPIDTGFGRLDLPIPIDATVPISTVVPIEFQQTVALSTNIDVDLVVPIEIDLSSPQLSNYLQNLHDALVNLRQQF